MRMKAKTPKSEKRDGRMNLPEMASAQGVVLCLAKIARLRASNRVDSKFVEDFCRLGSTIIKALEQMDDPGRKYPEISRLMRAYAKEMVSGPVEGVESSRDPEVPEESGAVQDDTRGTQEPED